MVTNSPSTLSKLIKDYQQQQNRHPFLLVDLSGGKENTHTNILKSLLSFNNNMFFGSFLEDVLGAPKWNEKPSVEISTQRQAIGLKPTKYSSGYIDLYISYETEEGKPITVVIENKINGAGDTPKQMLRYIATVKTDPIVDVTGFDDWKKKIESGDSGALQKLKADYETHLFFYLTLDGLSDPHPGSLPPFLYQTTDDTVEACINYSRISYQNNILSWLKVKVLPICPYFDNGITLAGLLQYISSLEEQSSKCVVVSELVQQYVSEKLNSSTNSISELYERINKDISELNKYNWEDSNRLVRELQNAVDALFSKNYAPQNWVLHYSPSFTILYKSEWMRLGRGSYSIPFVHFCTAGDILKKKKNVNWKLHIEHFASGNREKNQGKNWISFTNHDRTAFCSLKTEACEFELTKNYFVELINDKLTAIVGIIDECVRSVESEKKNLDTDQSIRQKLFDALLESFEKNPEDTQEWFQTKTLK